LIGKSTSKYKPMLKSLIISMLLFLPQVKGQQQSVTADIFFLDLGIVIEPRTGNETYSHLVKAPVEDAVIRIKKIQSGAIYTTASKEALTSLDRLNNHMKELESELRLEIERLEKENTTLRTELVNFKQPKALNVSTINGEAQNQEHQNDFNQKIYTKGAIAYQKEDYKKCLEHFSALTLSRAKPKTRSNVLYWMGDAHQQIGDYANALIVLDLLLEDKSSKQKDDALAQKGLIYQKTGKTDLAKDTFSLLIHKYPKSEYVTLATLELNKSKSKQQ